MVDERIVSKKLEQIEQYHGELRAKRHSISRDTFLTDITEQRAVERMFENVIQATIDLSKHVATTEFDYDGDRSREAIEILEENDVLEPDTARTVIDAVGFRNILAHEYGSVDPERVFTYLQGELSIYEQFSQEVAIWYDGETSSDEF